MTTIYIEVLVFIIVLVLIIILWLWAKISKWIAVRRYKPENDKGKLAEESRQQLIELAERERRTKREANALTRSRELERRVIVPPTSLSVSRKDSVSTRKTGGRIRALFKGRK